jgi:hypothetical protein
MIYISSQNETSGQKQKINTLLFPNNHDPDNWIDAGETKVIGRLGELQVQPPFGKDVITVVTSEKQFSDIEGLTGGAQEAYHTEVSSNTRGALEIRTRGIQVVRPEDNTTVDMQYANQTIAPVATDTCFIVSHP